jgi:hypothetical protein
VLTLIGLGYALRGILNSKATGIAAVAGGFAEGLVLWAIVTMVIGQITAIILLARTFPGGSRMQSLLSALSICMSTLMLIFVGAFLLMVWHRH